MSNSMFNPGVTGCAIVTLPVHGRFKAIVAHGLNEGHYTYAGSASGAAAKLKEAVIKSLGNSSDNVEFYISHAQFSA